MNTKVVPQETAQQEAPKVVAVKRLYQEDPAKFEHYPAVVVDLAVNDVQYNFDTMLPEPCVVHWLFIAAATRTLCKKAFQDYTGLPSKHLFYEHGAWEYSTPASSPQEKVTTPYDGGFILFVHNAVPGYIAAGHFAVLAPYLSPSELRQLSDWLNTCWG